MYALAWKEFSPNSNSCRIRMKSFSSDERRQDFIDSLSNSGKRIEITSRSSADSHELADFRPGMRVKALDALRAEVIGVTGTVKKTVKRNYTVWVKLDNGVEYGFWAWNLGFV